MPDSNIIFTREEGNLKKEEEVRLWQNRIENTIKWVKDYWNGWPSWRAAYKLDRAIHWGEAKAITEKSQDSNSQITVPLIATHVRNLMPFLFSSDPVFYGIPNLTEADSQDEIRDALAQVDYLNYAWHEHKMTSQAEKAALDAAIIGHGICRTGWGIEAEIPKTEDIAEKGEINFQQYIRSESPYIRRINPFLFLRDQFSADGDLDSSRWCAEMIIQSFQDIIDNELYNESIRDEIANGNIPIMKVKEFKDKYQDDEENMFGPINKEEEVTVGPDDLGMLYKIYDRKFGNIFYLIPGYDKGILRLDDWREVYPHLTSFPFSEVHFEEIPNEPFGYGHARYLADTQHQINRNRTKLWGITRSFNPAWTYSGPPMDKGLKNRLKLDKPNEIYEMPQGGQLSRLDTPKASEDLYRMASIADSDYSQISGEDILLRGGQLSSRTSAEEVREISRLRGLRLETNVKNVHNFVLDLADQVLRHAKRYMTKSMVTKIIGRPGEGWTSISPEQIKRGKVSLRMNVISKPLESPETKRRQLFELFTIMTNPNVYQLLKQSKVIINIKALWKELIDTFNIPSLDIVFPGLNEPLPQIDLQNPGNTAGFNQSNPNSTSEIQSDNVSPSSNNQGIEGIFNALGRG